MLTQEEIKKELGYRWIKRIISAEPSLSRTAVQWALNPECKDLAKINKVQAAASKAIAEMQALRDAQEALKGNVHNS